MQSILGTHQRCDQCHKNKPITEFRRPYTGWPYCCKQCRRQRARNSNLRSSYGMSNEDYLALLGEQDGLCRICHQPPKVGGHPLYVDHNHKTGQIRGLLCSRCNQLVGYLEMDPDLRRRAEDYLAQYEEEMP